MLCASSRRGKTKEWKGYVEQVRRQYDSMHCQAGPSKRTTTEVREKLQEQLHETRKVQLSKARALVKANLAAELGKRRYSFSAS